MRPQSAGITTPHRPAATPSHSLLNEIDPWAHSFRFVCCTSAHFWYKISLLQCWWEFWGDIGYQSHSQLHGKSGVETTRYLQIVLRDRRWIFSVRRTNLRDEIRFVDLRRISGLYIGQKPASTMTLQLLFAWQLWVTLLHRSLVIDGDYAKRLINTETSISVSVVFVLQEQMISVFIFWSPHV